jgi:hypothetical protein
MWQKALFDEFNTHMGRKEITANDHDAMLDIFFRSKGISMADRTKRVYTFNAAKIKISTRNDRARAFLDWFTNILEASRRIDANADPTDREDAGPADEDRAERKRKEDDARRQAAEEKRRQQESAERIDELDNSVLEMRRELDTLRATPPRVITVPNVVTDQHKREAEEQDRVIKELRQRLKEKETPTTSQVAIQTTVGGTQQIVVQAVPQQIVVQSAGSAQQVFHLVPMGDAAKKPTEEKSFLSRYVERILSRFQEDTDPAAKKHKTHKDP